MNREVEYRRKLADGFLQEADEDGRLFRWRACVSNSQLAAENAAKAALALLGPVGRTHNPASLIRKALTENRIPPEWKDGFEKLAAVSEQLGSDIHVESDYGDDASWRTPWELFNKDDADQTLRWAHDACRLLGQLIALSELK